MSMFTRENGVVIYYELISDADNSGDLCILLGGLTRDHTIWRKLVPLLRRHYQLLILDNRDVGKSTSSFNSEYEITDMAEDVAELVKKLNLPPAHVVGHSMGGFMAIHLAAKHPELIKTLTLCSTTEKQVPAGVEYLKTRIRLIDSQPGSTATTASKEDVMAVMDKIYSAEILLDKNFVKEIILHETSNPNPQSGTSFKRQAKACIQHDASSLLTDILCPVLVVTGEKDNYYTPEVAKILASKIKNARVVIIPHSGHIIQLEQPVLFYDALNNFFNEHQMIRTFSPKIRSNL